MTTSGADGDNSLRIWDVPISNACTEMLLTCRQHVPKNDRELDPRFRPKLRIRHRCNRGQPNMPPITKPIARGIIDDFAKEVRKKRMQSAKPSMEVINFRTDVKDGVERPVWQVPITILRFRKDNGRISSDVMDYERNIAPLSETDDAAQEQIRRFLEEKDPEKTSVLRSSIMHAGQLHATIITCDGFLINGNRRKMVMDALHKERPEDPAFAYMKCVILPGQDDEGGPPTLLEIEKLENRYQLQSDGKSEYYGFDRALSIKRKIDLGLSLDEQLRDDPRFAGATVPQLEKAKKECEKEYLRPLECIDRYLKQFKREGQYRTISTGMADPEGRWQAFKDFSDIYASTFSSPKKLVALGIEEDEIGGIEEAAFDIIRLRTIPDMPKVHQIMRDLPKYCGTKQGKHEILRIAEEVDPVLPASECMDRDGKPLSLAELDARWAAKFKKPIIYHLKKAASRHEAQKDKETPLTLLEAAYKKLTHANMDLSAIASTDLHKARELTAKINDRAAELEKEIYHHEKEYKKLLGKKHD